MLILHKLWSILGILCAISIIVFGFTTLALKNSDRLRSWDDILDVLKDRFVVSILVVTACLIVSAFSYGFILDHITRKELLNNLKSYDSSAGEIWVNKVKAENPEVIVKELATVTSIFNHRPSGESLKVTMLADKKPSEIRLTRSLYDSTIYLVYYTKPELFTDYHVGEIRSNLFNKY